MARYDTSVVMIGRELWLNVEDETGHLVPLDVINPPESWSQIVERYKERKQAEFDEYNRIQLQGKSK